MVIDAIADDHLLSLLEWSPTIVVVAPAYSKVASWGIRVDAVTVDHHTHSDVVVEGTVHTGPARVIDVGDDLAESVLIYLRSIGQHALQILVEDPLSHFHEWDAADFQVSLIDRHVKWSRIHSGHFEKWMPDHDILQVRAAGSLTVSGGEFTGDQIQVTHAGMVRLTSPSFFWIGERHR